MSSNNPLNHQSQLVMTRVHLENLPQPELKSGYRLRSYTPGDEVGWNALVSECFGTPYDFATTLGSDALFLPERVLFIEHENEIVATASAWRTPPLWGERTGVVHMVAASPRHAGHSLGYQVSLAVLHRFVTEGVQHAVLRTDDFRLPAIATYLKLDFKPYLDSPDHAGRWDAIHQNLK